MLAADLGFTRLLNVKSQMPQACELAAELSARDAQREGESRPQPRSYMRTECRSVDDAHERFAHLMPPVPSEEQDRKPWAPGEAPNGREPYLRGEALRAACSDAATRPQSIAAPFKHPFVRCEPDS